jgi:hypothetical protein
MFIPNLLPFFSTRSTVSTKPMNAIKETFRPCMPLSEGGMDDALTPAPVVTVTVYGEVPSAGKSIDGD